MVNPVQKIIAFTAVVWLLGFAGLSLWHGGRIALSDMNSLPTRFVVKQWGMGKGMAVTPETWEAARKKLNETLQLTPDNAQLWEDLGYLYGSRAQSMGWPKPESPEEKLRQNLLTDAIASYRTATVLRPTFPYPWAYIAMAKYLKGVQDEEFWLAFDNTLKFGLYAEGVQPILAKLSFAQWAHLSPERKELVTLALNASKGATRKIVLTMIAEQGVQVSGM